jgi:predicted transcriptional regulator
MTRYIITPTQLKAARNVLNLGIRDIAILLKVSKDTINKAELGKTRDFFNKHSASLINFFERNQITFPTEYSIRFHPHKNFNQHSPTKQEYLTRFQLKTSRSIISLNQSELAKATLVTKGVITRLEQLSNEVFINPKNLLVTTRLLFLFQQHNIEFPDPFYVFFKKL